MKLELHRKSEVGDIYRDISLVTNIEGFLAYRCIYVVYQQPLSEVSRWCCVDDKNFIPIIVDVVFILANPNLIPSPCPVCNQISPGTCNHLPRMFVLGPLSSCWQENWFCGESCVHNCATIYMFF